MKYICMLYLYSYEAKRQYLINIREKVGIFDHNDPRAYTKYSKDIHDVYKNMDDYNPDDDNKNLIDFNDMIADMVNITRLNSIVTELFVTG